LGGADEEMTRQQHYMDTMLAVLYSNFHALIKRKCDGGSLVKISPTKYNYQVAKILVIFVSYL
jgi:hypothetical protein